MKRMYTYKFRLKPTAEQEVLLAKHFGCCRYVYNHFLEQRIVKYKDTKKGSSYYDDATALPKLKQELPWLTEVGSQSLQFAVRCLQNGYDNFFRKVKQKVKGKKGFPRFKSRHRKDSFRLAQNVKLQDNKVIMPKFLEGIEYIPDPRKVEGEIEFATITKNKAGQYYVSITVTKEIQPLPKLDTVIGIDMNKKAIVDSNGKSYFNPNPAEKHKDRVRFLSKALSRTRKGTKELVESNGRKKARAKLAGLQLHIHNIREDFLHKLSKTLIDENQVICVEDLSVKRMLANVPPEKRTQYRSQEKRHHREIADAGWCSLRTKLQYKSEWYGRTFLKVDRYYPSSQTCHHCGWRYKDLPVDCKEWCCWECWQWNNRDENAAMNICDEGLKQLPLGTEDKADCLGVRPAISGLLIGSETQPSLAAG